MSTATKTYPTGTTKEQWDQYEIKKLNHEIYMNSIKPVAAFYEGMPEELSKAWSEWKAKFFMDAPNKPGYFRANND